MANPFFNAMGGRQSVPGTMGNMMNMMQQFQQFQQNFRGDPRQEVEKLLQSGRLNQDQLNHLQMMAQQFSSMLQR